MENLGRLGDRDYVNKIVAEQLDRFNVRDIVDAARLILSWLFAGAH